MRKPSTSSRSGFTIIELLIVAGIIALLMALLIPAVHAIKRRARTSQCQNHLHYLGIAYNERVLSRGRPGEDPWAWKWHRELAEYVDYTADMFACPEAHLAAAQPEATASFERIVNHKDYGENIHTHDVPINSGNLHFLARTLNPTNGAKNDNAAYVLDFSIAERGGTPTIPFVIEPRRAGAVVTVSSVNEPSGFGDSRIEAVKEYRINDSNGEFVTLFRPNSLPSASFQVLGIPPISFGMNSGVEQFTQDDNRVLIVDYHQLVANISEPVETLNLANNFGDGQLDNWNGSDFSNDPVKGWDPTDNDPPPPTIAPRHDGLCNVLFAGGNVKHMDPNDLNAPDSTSAASIALQKRWWTPRTLQDEHK